MHGDRQLKLRSRPALRLTLLMMRLCGGWAPTNARWTPLYWGYSTLVVGGLGVLFLVSQIVNVFTITDLQVIIDISYILIEHIAFLCKFAFIVANRKQVRTLVEMLDSDLFTSQTESQDHHIQSAMWIVRRNSRMFFGCVTTCCTLLALSPILMGERHPPYVCWFPFDPTPSPIYELVYIWEALAIPMSGLLNASIDLLSSGLMALACGQMRVLADALRNARKTATEKLTPSRTNSSPADADVDVEMYAEVRRCVQHHQAILRFLENLETTCSFSVFSQFASSVLVICITAFELTVISLGDAKLYSLFAYQVVMLSEIFLYCWYGNEVYYTSLEVCDAAYMAAWENSGKKVRVALCLIMDRARRPVLLTAGKFLPLTLDTFTAILRLSYSFFALLTQMHE